MGEFASAKARLTGGTVGFELIAHEPPIVFEAVQALVLLFLVVALL
jgi:hypothetical protein